MKTHKHTRALVIGNRVIPQGVEQYTHLRKESMGDPLAISIKAHFQTVDSSLVTFHFYTDKKVQYDPSDIVVFIFFLTKIYEKESGETLMLHSTVIQIYR